MNYKLITKLRRTNSYKGNTKKRFRSQNMKPFYKLNCIVGYDFNISHTRSSYGNDIETNADPGFLYRLETYRNNNFNLGMGFGTYPNKKLIRDKKARFTFVPMYMMAYYKLNFKYIDIALKANLGISLLLANSAYDKDDTKSGFYFASGIETPIQKHIAFEFLYTSCNGEAGNNKVNNQVISISFVFSFDYYDF